LFSIIIVVLVAKSHLVVEVVPEVVGDSF
jgi:hypothetical protein